MSKRKDSDLYIEVDINTRIMDDAENIYVVRPGMGSWLFTEFERLNGVFLDFPKLELDLTTKPKDFVELRRKLVRSIEYRKWLKGRRDEDPPSLALADYANKTHRRRLGRYVGAVETLYYELPEGTIVAVPGPSDVSDVLVGRIVGPAKISNSVIPYHGEGVPVRPVEWLGRKQKASFKKDLRDRLATPNPVMILDRSLREDILRVGFDQYVINGRFSSRFKTESLDYSSLDDADITNFVNYIAGLLVSADELDFAPGSVTERDAIAALRQFRDRVPELATNINSPGFLRLLSTRIDPIAIAVLMAVALSGAAAAHPAAIHPDALHVVNSAGSIAHECVIRVSEQSKSAMSMMTFDDFQEKCTRFVEAAHNVKLKSSVSAAIKHVTP